MIVRQEWYRLIGRSLGIWCLGAGLQLCGMRSLQVAVSGSNASCHAAYISQSHRYTRYIAKMDHPRKMASPLLEADNYLKKDLTLHSFTQKNRGISSDRHIAPTSPIVCAKQHTATSALLNAVFKNPLSSSSTAHAIKKNAHDTSERTTAKHDDHVSTITTHDTYTHKIRSLRSATLYRLSRYVSRDASHHRGKRLYTSVQKRIKDAYQYLQSHNITRYAMTHCPKQLFTMTYQEVPASGDSMTMSHKEISTSLFDSACVPATCDAMDYCHKQKEDTPYRYFTVPATVVSFMSRYMHDCTLPSYSVQSITITPDAATKPLLSFAIRHPSLWRNSDFYDLFCGATQRIITFSRKHTHEEKSDNFSRSSFYAAPTSVSPYLSRHNQHFQGQQQQPILYVLPSDDQDGFAAALPSIRDQYYTHHQYSAASQSDRGEPFKYAYPASDYYNTTESAKESMQETDSDQTVRATSQSLRATDDHNDEHAQKQAADLRSTLEPVALGSGVQEPAVVLRKGDDYNEKRLVPALHTSTPSLPLSSSDDTYVVGNTASVFDIQRALTTLATLCTAAVHHIARFTTLITSFIRNIFSVLR